MATRRRVPARLPRPLYPLAAERQYAARLRGLVDAEVDKVMRRILERWPPDLAESRADARRQYVTGPNDFDRDIFGLPASISAGVERTSWVNEAGNLVNEGNGRAIVEQLRGVATVNPLRDTPWIRPMLDSWRESNVSLIRNIGEDAAARISATVQDAWERGASVDSLKAQLGRDAGIVGRRAETIARDQVGKLNGQLSMVRQSELGIKRYRWQTTMDERVRQQHADRHGVIFEWDTPPPDGHPGMPVQCRCSAEPDIGDALDQLERDGDELVQLPDGSYSLPARAPDADLVDDAVVELGRYAPAPVVQGARGRAREVIAAWKPGGRGVPPRGQPSRPPMPRPRDGRPSRPSARVPLRIPRPTRTPAQRPDLSVGTQMAGGGGIPRANGPPLPATTVDDVAVLDVVQRATIVHFPKTRPTSQERHSFTLDGRVVQFNVQHSYPRVHDSGKLFDDQTHPDIHVEAAIFVDALNRGLLDIPIANPISLISFRWREVDVVYTIFRQGGLYRVGTYRRER